MKRDEGAYLIHDSVCVQHPKMRCRHSTRAPYPRVGPLRWGPVCSPCVFTLGVTVGAYWEIFEWYFIYKHPRADTISDLLVNSVGALAAALVALALRRSGDRLT
jgi:hypothetical protein